MATASLLFQHEVLRKESPAVTKRRNALLRLIPDIEKRYAKAITNTKLRALGKAPKEVSDAALQFYNAVVADGRYISFLAKDPQKAAEKLGLHVDPKALGFVQALVTQVRGSVTVEGPTEAVIAIAVVIASAVLAREQEEIVIDSSAQISLKL